MRAMSSSGILAMRGGAPPRSRVVAYYRLGRGDTAQPADSGRALPIIVISAGLLSRDGPRQPVPVPAQHGHRRVEREAVGHAADVRHRAAYRVLVVAVGREVL